MKKIKFKAQRFVYIIAIAGFNILFAVGIESNKEQFTLDVLTAKAGIGWECDDLDQFYCTNLNGRVYYGPYRTFGY